MKKPKTQQPPKLKRINVALAHKRLWSWMSEDLSRRKKQWPEWRSNGGAISNDYVVADCFPCTFSSSLLPGDRNCPLQTHKCSRLTQGCLDRLYRDSHSSLSARLQIALLPWNGPKLFPINEQGEIQWATNNS